MTVMHILPIDHRIDAKIVFIAPGDRAWNDDEIARVESVIKGREQAREGEVITWTMLSFPLTRYWMGESRGDVATVQQWLRPNVTPVEYHCRALDIEQWAEAKHLHERGLNVAHAISCVRYGLTNITGLKDDQGRPAALFEGGPPLTNATINRVRWLLGDEHFQMLGRFIWQASQAPTPAETFR